MSRQSIVIGLGQFGMSLAKALTREGCDVLAVDILESKIAEVAPHVADAVVLDAMEEEALASLAPEKRDFCICAIGDENREGGIVVTALLKQFGAKNIIARATDRLHGRILKLVGAHEVVNPESHYGERLAIRLSWRNVINVMHLGGDLVMSEIQTPESFWGRSLAELNLREKFQVNVSAVRRQSESEMNASIPDPRAPLERGDILMMVGTEAAVRKLVEKT